MLLDGELQCCKTFIPQFKSGCRLQRKTANSSLRFFTWNLSDLITVIYEDIYYHGKYPIPVAVCGRIDF